MGRGSSRGGGAGQYGEGGALASDGDCADIESAEWAFLAFRLIAIEF
jgi:hypothetical protein